MAADSPRMTSLPGERASSARLVTRPYPTAASAQIERDDDPVVGKEIGQREPSLQNVQTNTKSGGRSRIAAGAARSLSRRAAAKRR